MKILVKTNPNSKQESITLLKQSALDFGMFESLPVYKVCVKEIPSGGLANKAVTHVLAKHFNVPRSKIQLVSGQTSKQKTFIIEI